MPQYEYRCDVCEHVQTLLRNVSERMDMAYCPECGNTCTKAVSAASHKLVGTGWARDNYANKKVEP